MLVISPGAASTKIGIYDNEKCIVEETLRHETEELNRFPRMMDQYPFRKKAILDTLHENGMNVTKLNAIVGSGGVLRPNLCGTYEVNQLMLEDLRTSRFVEHASNLGAIIAYEIAAQLHIPAYIVDPAVGDELADIARMTGSPLFERKSENELQALAEGALRVLRQEEEAKVYTPRNEVK